MILDSDLVGWIKILCTRTIFGDISKTVTMCPEKHDLSRKIVYRTIVEEPERRKEKRRMLEELILEFAQSIPKLFWILLAIIIVAALFVKKTTR